MALSGTTDTPAFEELAKLVKTSFPNLLCLRCGNDSFFLSSNAKPRTLADLVQIYDTSQSIGDTLLLACSNCGHIEQHLTSILEKAEKPIRKVRK
jgi:predicted nucleic-acid-binding Zn-ribbon protein